jgi:hypothetical protein
MNTEVNYKNVRYGMLVEVLNDSGYHAGCKVHFYNKKGVLVGNYYNFLPYERLKMRTPKNRHYQRFFYGERFETIKNALFRIPLKVTDILIRFTQLVLD